MEKKENLISIEEIIRRAKDLGVDFGKGDPKNRLRYYTKIGLLPHAQRVSFKGGFPTGAYPESVISILVFIDKKLKEGKSILQIKRELEKERERIKEGISPFRLETESLAEISPLEIGKKEIRISKKRKIDFQKIFKKYILWVLFSVSLISFSFVFFTNKGKFFLSKISETLIAQLNPEKLVQETMKAESKNFVFPYLEPYLTINADTQLNGSLKIRDSLSFQREGYEAFFDFEKLTENRTYTFPNQTGIVCLTSGNCFGIFGEVKTRGGTPNRISKFVGPNEIANSSISDLFAGGTSIAISDAGNVGIGTETPRYKLHVIGRIQATDDICTDLAGGKCLSQLIPFFARGAAGITGTGSPGTLALWVTPGTIGSSIIYQSGENIGIGVPSPTQKLDVAGIIKVLGFQMPTNATSGYVLMSDEQGFGTWQPLIGALPPGQIGQTLRHDGTNWVANDFLYNTGSAIGIGTTTTLATLTVSGSGVFLGELTVESLSFPQLVLRYDANNYLQFLISSTSTTMQVSKDLIINSLTGEIIASDATITANTFRASDATVRAPGEYVFRQSIPIFKFSTAAQTASTSFVQVSRYFAQGEYVSSTVPSPLPNTTRRYGFLINEADDIATTSSSTWRIFRPAANETYATFTLSGLEQSDLTVGKPRLIGFTDLPDDDWQLDVQVPDGNKIRIFNIFLLVYDQLL
jgi:DNA-binding transcriptional MerR regulator